MSEAFINRSEVSRTDSDGSPIKGNPVRFYGNAFVCFIDLLGFSNAVVHDWGAGRDSPLSRLLRIKCNPIISEKKSIAFSIYFDGPDGEKIRPYGTYESRVASISDSITVCVALPQKIHFGEFCLGYWAFMAQIGHVWYAAIQEGFTIRGAFEFGQIFWDEAEIIGPALAVAYQLESQIAKTSRVIAGPSFLKALLHFMSGHDATNAGIRDVLPFLLKTHDGMIAAKPLGQLGGKRAEVLPKVEELQAAAGDSNRRSKYDELIGWLQDSSTIVTPTRSDLLAYAESLKEIPTVILGQTSG